MLKDLLPASVSILLIVAALSGNLDAGPGAAVSEEPLELAFDDLTKWTVASREAELIEYRGRRALRLGESPGSGVAFLKDLDFCDGTIELDIAAIPRFTGLVFRVRDAHVYEGVYFRPQNSRHLDPAMRARTVQYISHPSRTWYTLREKFPGRYEAAVDIAPNEWFHVKVAVSGSEARVFVNGSETPCLVVPDLMHRLTRGSVGVWCGNGSAGTFANLKVTPDSGPDDGLDDAGSDTPAAFTPEQEYLFDVFRSRRSVRKFRPDPVPDEHLMKILDMARMAPTSGNQQPWKFFVIKDRDKLDELKEACIARRVERSRANGIDDSAELDRIEKRAERYFGDYLSAPVYVAVLVDSGSRYPAYNTYDGSLAGGYLMLAARALGYGTVFSQDSIPYDLIREVFGIPDSFERICFTPIGVPLSWPEPPEKKPLRDFVVFEKFVPGINYTPSVQRKAIELDAESLQAFVGRYEVSSGYKVAVTREGGRLFAQGTGQAKVEIFPETEARFFLEAADLVIEFEKNDAGEATGLVIEQGDQKVPARKIE